MKILNAHYGVASPSFSAEKPLLSKPCTEASSAYFEVFILFTSPILHNRMVPPAAAPTADTHGSGRMFCRHQELMRVYSASTRRSSSVASEISSIASHNDRLVSQNDLEIIKQKFQFIRDDEADAEQGEMDWQIRMSVRYYRQLFREYALADLSRFKEGKIGLRWRTEMEVVAGKGQFSCGNKRCDERAGLHSYELLFAYMEHGERKRCLVKVRACSACAEKLFYKKLMEMRRKSKDKKEKRERKRRRLESGSVAKQEVKPSRSCSGSSSEHDESGDERKGASDLDEDIHELCAKINAEQKATYPFPVSARANGSDKREGGFDELLP
ncbi:hypothetical protein PI124_g16282 [Phytophthora idaei]|nr:hypothetical protein PI125_g16456 [Phytophthora idaei]KAG3141844.1 hypothetical protein PI126_g15308 [Phytophthora idaei]KAG3238766.1 hypothetical protein PI124_g16282 [Phytophthora idaei]